MKAMILAAGLGTRLRPLTDNRPKAMVKVAGHTLLDITLRRLRSFGIHEVIVNVHHFAEMLVDYLNKNSNFGMRIEISREDVLLDTGGGLKKAAWFFLEGSGNEPFLLHNVDVLSTIDFAGMLDFHRDQDALATLAVQDRKTSRYLVFDEQFHLCGRRAEGEEGSENAFPSKREALAFCGVHIISPRLLSLLTEEGAFSIIDAYLRLATQGGLIRGFRADKYYWRDLGKPENVTIAEQDVQRHLLRI